MKNLFRANEQRINAAHAEVDRAFKARDGSDEAYDQWKKACENFHQAMEECSYPGGLEEACEKLRSQNPDAIETAINFLEADPMYHRSGYIKEEVIRRIKRIELTEKQCARLRKVILTIVDSGDRREFRRYCQLAAKIMNDSFLQELTARGGLNDSGIRRRAIWVLEVCSEAT